MTNKECIDILERMVTDSVQGDAVEMAVRSLNAWEKVESELAGMMVEQTDDMIQMGLLTAIQVIHDCTY